MRGKKDCEKCGSPTRRDFDILHCTNPDCFRSQYNEGWQEELDREREAEAREYQDHLRKALSAANKEIERLKEALKRWRRASVAVDEYDGDDPDQFIDPLLSRLVECELELEALAREEQE